MAQEKSKDRPTVLIGLVTHHGEFAPKMSMALDALVKRSCKDADLAIFKAFSAMLPHNRNLCAAEAIKLNASHLLFIDSDMVFDDDALLTLLKHDRDIVSGLCVARKPPFRPVAKVLREDGVYVVRENLGDGRFYSDLDGLGAAFLLVKTDVFRKTPPPWFAMPPFKTGVMGEDIYFSKVAKEHGYDLCIDSSLVIGHIGEHTYTIYDHENYMETQGSGEDLVFV